MTNFNLNKKRIVVFGGAGKKIGLPISTGLAVAGAKVTIASRNASRTLQNIDFDKKLKIDCIDVDASNEQEMRSIFDGSRTFDGCVFCSTIRPMTEYLDSDISTWQKSVLINSTSLYLSNVLAANHMKDNGVVQ